MNIRLIITGGTIDKAYNPLSGDLEFEKTHLNQILQQGRSTVDVTVEELLLVDSLDMTEAQRAQVVAACDNAQEQNVVITHGTDTMVQTAKAIKQSNLPGLKNKVIVLTGSMVPYSFGTSSDALFNIGAAISFAQTLPPDVYIAMNGRYFTSDNVRKNKELGIFEELK